MVLLSRTLAPRPVTSLDDYLADGGGQGLAVARETEPDAVIATIEESGLRARGGAGVPCGPKWRRVRFHAAGATASATVVVNAADGEPGSFKDRAILQRNPYRVLEGALIAAHAIGAETVIVAMKHMNVDLVTRSREAIGEAHRAGWLEGLDVQLFEGPNEYLFGEETAMLEAIDGRPPFPRIAPPYRRGVHEIADSGSGAGPVGASASHVEMAGPSADAIGAPTLVNNVETLANVPAILSKGPDWFRSIGTREPPGSIVCTITGATHHHGVGEVAMGTPLREAIKLIGGGPRPGRTIKAVLGGIATSSLTGDQLDTPVSNEAMADIGAQLGCGGFIVLDDSTDMAAVAEGVARFLAIESCGLCIPCKEDGLALTEIFGRIRRSQPHKYDRADVDDRLRTIDDGARCSLARQYQLVIQSILDNFADEIDAHVRGDEPAAEPELITTIVTIDKQQAVLDENHLAKQPDWTFEPRWSGKTPADVHVSVSQR